MLKTNYYSTSVLCSRKSDTVWEVSCGRCVDPIGTMTGEGLQRAIFSTMGRGGVLCPDCRLNTCDFCGLTKTGAADVLTIVWEKEWKAVKACKDCRGFLIDMGEYTPDQYV